MKEDRKRKEMLESGGIDKSIEKVKKRGNDRLENNEKEILLGA